jgi:hypothetical protein
MTNTMELTPEQTKLATQAATLLGVDVSDMLLHLLASNLQSIEEQGDQSGSSPDSHNTFSNVSKGGHLTKPPSIFSPTRE